MEGEVPPEKRNSERPKPLEAIRSVAPETQRERLLQRKIAEDSRIPIESLEHPAVAHFVNIVAGVNLIAAGYHGFPEIQLPQTERLDSVTTGAEDHLDGWPERFT